MSLHWTQEEYAAWLRKGQPQPVSEAGASRPPSPPSPPSPWAPYRSHTEQRYAALLALWQHGGMVTRWRYEAVRVTLAPQTTLTVDFMLTMAGAGQEGQVQMHEVKGGWVREDAWVKLKTAAALYPEWRFVLVQWQREAWVWRDVPAGAIRP